MLDVRRTILALFAALSVCTLSVAQERDPKEADEVLKSQTPPAAQPVEDATPLSPDKPAARAPAMDETKDSPSMDESEGKRLLRRSAEAIRAARAISYSAKAYSTGALESLTPKADGQVKMRRVAGGAPDAWLARITGRTTKKGGKAGDGESLDFDVAYLGNKRIEWADAKAQKIVEKVDRSAQSPIVQGAKSLRIDEFFAVAPYTRDLTAGTATILDRKTIAGVECEVVQIEMGERKNKTRWYLGLGDYLPRRVDRVIEGAMASEVIVEASDLKVETSEDPSIAASSLRIPVPPGWTEEREPVAPPPQPVQPTPVGADPKTDVVPSKIDAPATPTMATPAVPAPPPPPRVAPEFELTTSKGEKVSLQALRDSGASAVVLDFFGPWSLLARDWHPRLDDLTKRFADRGVRVLALSVRAKNNDDSITMTKDFSFATVLNADKVARDYAIAVYPTTVVINRSGEIVRTIPGSKEDLSDTVAEAIEEAITGQKPAPKRETSTPAAPPPSSPSPKPDDSAAKSEAEKADQAKDAEEGRPDSGSTAQ